MAAEERKIIQDKKKGELENCFNYIEENFTSWDYSFDDPWYKEIQYKEKKKNEQKMKNSQKLKFSFFFKKNVKKKHWS